MATQATSTFSRLAVEISAPAVRIMLHNPPLNVIDVPMMRELQQVLSEVDARPDISTIVIEGVGSAFSAGVDIKAHTPDKVDEMLREFHSVIRALVATRKVTICAVRGACLGGGAEIALVCDMVYTARDASWGFPEIRLGCYPPVAAVALPAVVGQKKAEELILTGRQISGEESVAIGLANKSARSEEVSGLVNETLAQLSRLSPAALGIAKKSVYAWDAIHFDKGLARAENIYHEELMATDDAHEGIKAFLEKREPRWKGR
ncbi:MAG TPA: enoyl-CoA hydratase/isomerase family protein [Terriglobales bacterium]|nr:enoyl-CoA hydratase/isomerase family protein [Terriglobales bacterium]